MKPGPKPKFIDPEKIIEYLQEVEKPKGLNAISRVVVRAKYTTQVGFRRAISELETVGRIQRVPWRRGFGYITREKNMTQYIVKAKATKPVTIETDTRQRAVELAGIFSKNGWADVRVECQGREYHWPKLQRELP